jgi:3-methyladenine DNA glycosylase AlkD
MADVETILRKLERLGTKKNRDGMARYGIEAVNAFGVSAAPIQKLAKEIGRDHALAESLWQTGWFEARLLAAFVDEPAKVTAAQMDRWARSFENWADCDTVCFKLFDRTPHAWRKVEQWSSKKAEFTKRASFALLASLALHDKKAADENFLRLMPLIEREAEDGRNFVKKGQSWALRSIGRRNAKLRAAAIEMAERLSASANASARWIGRDALRDLKRKRPA